MDSEEGSTSRSPLKVPESPEESSPQKRTAGESKEAASSKKIKDETTMSRVQNVPTLFGTGEEADKRIKAEEVDETSEQNEIFMDYLSKLNNQLEVVKEDLEESRNKEELRRLLTDLLEPNCPRLNDPKFVKDMIAFINASHNQSWSTDDEDGSGNDSFDSCAGVADGQILPPLLPTLYFNVLQNSVRNNLVDASLPFRLFSQQWPSVLTGNNNVAQDPEVVGEGEAVRGVLGEEDPHDKLQEDEALVQAELDQIKKCRDVNEIQADEKLKRRFALRCVMNGTEIDYAEVAKLVWKYLKSDDQVAQEMKINAFVKNILFGYRRQDLLDVIAYPNEQLETADGRKILWRMVNFITRYDNQIEESLRIPKSKKRKFSKDERALFAAEFDRDASLDAERLIALKMNVGLDRVKSAKKTWKEKRKNERRNAGRMVGGNGGG